MATLSESNATLFEANRQFLMGLAYRLLGRYSEAEDMVQETFLRWHKLNIADIRNPRSYLAQTVTRLCLDYLKSARVKREEYVGPWLPEPVLESQLSPVRMEDEVILSIEGMADLSYALMLTLERLSPLERAVFILHDVFSTSFGDIAEMLGRTEAACRQLASRARGNVKQEKKRFEPSVEEGTRLVKAFIEALSTHNTDALGELLIKDATFYSDGGGLVRAALRPLLGREHIVAFFKGVQSKGGDVNQFRVELIPLNGGIGLISYELTGDVQQTYLFDIDESQRITNIYVLRNPEKLRHLH